MNRRRVFLVAGGTGGHLFPALSVMKDLDDYYIDFITDKRTEKYLLEREIKYTRITTSKLSFNILFLFNLTKIFFGVIQSILILIKKRPDLVVGFGGYTCIPTIIASRILMIKVLVHEQNAVMGRTNRLLSKIVDYVAITFPNTAFAPTNSKYTGIPVRKKMMLKRIKSNKKRIFIVGGSQGANIFSEIIPKAFSFFDNKLKKKIKVIQQSRPEDIDKLCENFKNLGLDFEVKDFYQNIYNQYHNADLIITRCGASTLAEIQLFKKKSILFPLPSAMNNHQYFNAKEFKKNNDCLIIDEKNVDTKILSKDIEKLLFINKKDLNMYNEKTKNHRMSLSNYIKKILDKCS